jgi:nitrile hydratase subunit beta
MRAVARINDMGGTQGFGPVPMSAGEQSQPFHADWEARVFALSSVLVGEDRLFNADEFRDAIERMPPEEYLRASYYERWLTGLETLVREKGVLPDD